jgi:hypothetical protein
MDAGRTAQKDRGKCCSVEGTRLRPNGFEEELDEACRGARSMSGERGHEYCLLDFEHDVILRTTCEIQNTGAERAFQCQES